MISFILVFALLLDTIRTFTPQVPWNTSTKADTTYSILNPVTTLELANPTEDTEWPPKRTQEGQSSNCRDWHRVERGDTCESIVLNSGNWRMTVNELQDLAHSTTHPMEVAHCDW